MHVEIFHTAKPSNPEEIEKFKELVEKAGLTKQKELFDSYEEHPKLTTFQERVYRTLLRQQAKPEDYQNDVIPTEVLTEIVAVKMLGRYDNGMLIFYDSTSEIGTHVLIGLKKTGQYTSDEFLIALWSEKKEPFDQLAEKARKEKRVQQAEIYAQNKKELDTSIENIDKDIARWFKGDYVHSF
jgi:hypothetical protein